MMVERETQCTNPYLLTSSSQGHHHGHGIGKIKSVLGIGKVLAAFKG